MRAVLAGGWQYRARIDSATLCWQALHGALTFSIPKISINVADLGLTRGCEAQPLDDDTGLRSGIHPQE
jgi:hypothetical protein